MSGQGTVEKFVVINVLALVLVACGKPEAGTPVAAAPPAPTIDVSQVVTESIVDWDQHTGRLQAPETVVLIPRVSGYINKVNFEEGALVQAGEVLLEIDDRPFKAEVQGLRADLRSAQSAHKLANKDYDRAQRLRQQGAISEEIADARYSAKQQALAQVLSVQAALERAELDLEFTRVTAPISGRLSYAEVTAGNYVTAGQTQLTTLVSTSQMYAYFDVDETTYLNYIQAKDQVQTEAGKDDAVDHQLVYLGLANDAGYPYNGSIDFIDNSVNENTGTIRMRAVFDNDQQQFVPGLFARIKMAASAPYQAVLVDDKAVATDLNNKYVLVVNADNQVQYRSVVLGEKVQGLQVVKSGLKPGETIVVNGLQRIFPNMTITPNVVEMATAEQLAQIRQSQQLVQSVLDERRAVNQASLPVVTSTKPDTAVLAQNN